MTNQKKLSTRTLAIGAVLTAIVIVLQYLGSFIHLGPFSVSLVLLPIVIGAALCGPAISTWLGLVFGIVVLISGDAAAFLAVNVPGTIITVLLKGALAGLVAGVIYKLLEKFNKYVAVVVAAIACPVVNTGIFLIACRVFFFETIKEWAAGGNVVTFMFVGLVGLNFLVELAINVVLSPTVVKIINIIKKGK
ncbi:MAG: ECF transporter S component [Saccharofermentans sp.]|nr:ECF transporter S component [Saccharofermentans sp.]